MRRRKLLQLLFLFRVAFALMSTKKESNKPLTNYLNPTGTSSLLASSFVLIPGNVYNRQKLTKLVNKNIMATINETIDYVPGILCVKYSAAIAATIMALFIS